MLCFALLGPLTLLCIKESRSSRIGAHPATSATRQMTVARQPAQRVHISPTWLSTLSAAACHVPLGTLVRSRRRFQKHARQAHTATHLAPDLTSAFPAQPATSAKQRHPCQKYALRGRSPLCQRRWRASLVRSGHTRARVGGLQRATRVRRARFAPSPTSCHCRVRGAPMARPKALLTFQNAPPARPGKYIHIR